MSEENKSHEEKVVDDHRQMLLLSGNLSEFQLENLKKWPFVVFGTDLKKVDVSYNFVLEEEEADLEAGRNIFPGEITFDFTFNNKPDTDYSSKCITMLEMWTRFMFWKDTKVNFKVEGEEWQA